jgi:Na+/proline symporter
MLSFIDLIIVAVFFLLVLLIGFWERKKSLLTIIGSTAAKPTNLF